MLAHLKNIASLLLGVVLAAAGIAALYFAAQWLFEIFSKADANVQAAGVTGLVGVGLFAGGRVFDTRLKNEERRREKMVPIYDAMIDMFMRSRHYGDEIPESMTEDFIRLQQEMLIWAPPKVVKQFVDWRYSTVETDENEIGPAVLLSWEKLMFAMRKDVGNGNAGLATGDLLRVIINDWDDFSDGASGN